MLFYIKENPSKSDVDKKKEEKFKLKLRKKN